MCQEEINYIRSLNKRPSVKQYTKVAQEKNFLSVKSLLRLSGISNFDKFCATVRRCQK